MSTTRPLRTFLALLLAISPGIGQAGSIQFRFEKLFPALQQPWYFAPAGDIVLDGDDFIFVVERENERIRKFTRTGLLVTTWGRKGTGTGEFVSPIDLVIGEDDLLYVTDELRHDIQVFTKNGEYVRQFGGPGSGNGQFNHPNGIAYHEGFLYIVDSDNQRVQKLTIDGDYVTQWGTEGSGTGQFQFATGLSGFRLGDIAVSDDGKVYVTDTKNNRIQYFDGNGLFIDQWGSEGSANGQFVDPGSIEVDEFGIVYVVDTERRIQRFTGDGLFLAQIVMPAEELQLNFPSGLAKAEGRIYVRDLYRIAQFTPAGNFVDAFSSSGNKLGQYSFPQGINADTSGQIYIADQFNNRVQIHDPDGNPLSALGSVGSNPGQFLNPAGMDFDSNGRLYVVERGNDRVQVFGTALNSVDMWGSFGSGPGQFDDPVGIRLDSMDNVYVTDVQLHRVQKFSPTGMFITQWGSFGSGEGQFSFPSGIVIDDQDNIFIGDRFNHRIQVFDTTGTFRYEFGSFGSGNGEFDIAESLALDNDGLLFVSDVNNDRLQAFTTTGEFAGKYEFPGLAPGSLIRPGGVLFDNQNRVFVVGARNNRLQRFSRVPSLPNAKVVMAAGGGPYPGNALWNATQVNANYAYRTMVIRGFTKQLINYLSPDVNLDLDQNGEADDVDAIPTVASLREAITGSFTTDAANLILYLVDHGGDNTFRLTQGETVQAAELAGWLDLYQAAHPGSRVTVVYDACQAGSFMDDLRSSVYDRVVITSTSGQENAYFVSQGTLSFSNYFWTHVFNGLSVGDAFTLAAQSTTTSFPAQNPLIDANGDTATNTQADLDAVASLFIGSGEPSGSNAPQIGAVSGQQMATGNMATITASNVTDADEIGRVWAVMRPPGFSSGSPDNPVQDLPTFDLLQVGATDDYQAQFAGFSDPGTYQVAIHARDRIGNAAVPRLTSVVVENSLRRKAVIVSGGDVQDPGFAGFVRNANLANAALTQQGYGPDGVDCADTSCDDIYFLTNAAGAGFDATPTLANLQFGITSWGVQDAQDLTVYLVADEIGGQYRLSSTQSLDAATLKGWLDSAQTTLPGVVTVVVDGTASGSFVRALAPTSGENRFLVASADTGEPAAFLLDGLIAFSQFFWSQVLNGDNLRNAFAQASSAIGFRTSGQTPQLDGNGNGITNEIGDGLAARSYTIGSGVQLAGDSPFVANVQVNANLAGDFETITASAVTSTGQVDRVVAVVTQPGGSVVTQPLPARSTSFSDRSYGLCAGAGNYDVAVFVVDVDNNVSLPAVPTGTVNRAVACTDLVFFSGLE